MNDIRFIDMFGGVGGFRLGLEKAGEKLCNQDKDIHESACENRSEEGQHREPAHVSNKGFSCVGYYELDKYCVQAYNKNFNEAHNPADVRAVDWSKEPDFDLLCAGFPCQSFSLAGKRRGFEDARGTLFFEIVRAVRAKQPRLLFLENVKGLLSHGQGRTFGIILSALDEVGYDLQWKVLNSKNHGVPQNRERVFIIGNLRGTPRPEVFPIGESDCSHPQGNCRAVKKINEESPTMIHNIYGGFKEGIRTFEEYSPTIRSPKGGGDLPMVISHSPRKGNPKLGGTGPLVSSEHSFTLDSSPHIVNDIRRLTPTECERLQGFPDGWTAGVSDTQRYRMMGNAVTVNVIEEIGKRLLEALNGKE